MTINPFERKIIKEPSLLIRGSEALYKLILYVSVNSFLNFICDLDLSNISLVDLYDRIQNVLLLYYLLMKNLFQI